MISISPETTTKRPAATSPCLINNSPAFTGCVFPAVAIRAIWEGVSVGNSCSRRSGDKTGAVSGVAMASIRCARVYPGLSMLMDSKKLEGEVLAERVGFEPTIPVKVYTLSKRAPSATRPSLRAASILLDTENEERTRRSRRQRRGHASKLRGTQALLPRDS